MNGKQAKRLRKVALGMATYLDEAGRKISLRNQELEEHKTFGPGSFSSIISSQSNPPPDEPPKITYTIRNREDSLRDIYRKMKKAK